MPSCVLRYCTNNSSNTSKAKGVTFHLFPRHENREAWIEFVQINRSEGTWLPSDYSRICSLHFKEDDKYRSATNRIYLKRSAVPCYNDPAEDPLNSEADTVVVKIEAEEFSEEEDDPVEQLEMKRQREREISEAKKSKFDNVRLVEKVEVPIERNVTPSTSNTSKSSTNQVTIPEIFMKNMLRTQNEILNTLKSQVLMQDPDPKVLTFLRFLGAKMQKLSAERRQELQDRVIEIVLSEYDV